MPDPSWFSHQPWVSHQSYCHLLCSAESWSELAWQQSIGCSAVSSGSIVGAPLLHQTDFVSDLFIMKVPLHTITVTLKGRMLHCTQCTVAWLGQKGLAQTRCLLHPIVQGIS